MGLTANAHNFDALAPHLAAKYHVISVDVRGRGDSQWGPPTEYLPQNYMTDLARCSTQLGINRASLIGTSMGGIISIMYAGGWPDRVERLVLNDIGPEIDPNGLTRISELRGHGAGTLQRSRRGCTVLSAKIIRPWRRWTSRSLREQVQWSVKPGAEGGLIWKMDPNVRRPLRGGTAAQRLDLWVPYARIACPLLIVRGADSDVLAPRYGERMRAVGGRSKVVEVPGVGHAPSLTEPESLAAIKKFFGV